MSLILYMSRLRGRASVRVGLSCSVWILEEMSRVQLII